MSDQLNQDRTAALENFAHEFVCAIVTLEMHAITHQLVQDNLARMIRCLREALELGQPSPLRIDVHDNQLHVDGEVLLGSTLQAGKLTRLARERGIRSFLFGSHATAEEAGQFIELLKDEYERDAFVPGMLRLALAKHGIQNIQVALDDSRSEGEDAVHENAIEGYQALADVLQENHVAAHRGRHLELDRTKGVVEQAMAQMGSSPSELLALANYDDIDSFTVGHSVRVALLALQVAQASGAKPEDLMLVGTAALMHDIGKSRIPQSVLFKQGTLDDDEWAMMAEHPRLGAEILVEQDDLHPSAIGAAFCHHMAPQGGGYPKPALAFDPSGISKLVRVCDVFEALTAIRPYKHALTPVEAHVIMHRDQQDFDPVWLRFFVQVIGLYPLGSRLSLDTDELCIVERHGPLCDQPVVRLLTGPDGEPTDPDAPTVVTVGQEVDGITRQIASVRPRSISGTYRAASEKRVVERHPSTACLTTPKHEH